MKRRSLLTGLGLSAAAALIRPYSLLAQTAGWKTIFDGKSLDQWRMIGTANWRLEDGMAVADKGNGFLISKEMYGDFELKAEFWADSEVNSGIYIRCTDPNSVTTKTAYEVNIWDQRPEPSYGTGAIVNIGKVDPMPKAGGKWNTYEITAKGSTFNVVLNGQKTVSNAQDSQFARGHIALQHGLGLKNAQGVESDGGVVKFRKVEIRAL
jgi:hypothetical protein